MNNSYRPTRRTFIRQAACAALGTSGLLSTIWDLRKLSAATAVGDYKALVCLFLYGGNDANNVLIPNDTSFYNSYANARGQLAIARNALHPLTVSVGDGRNYGFHPDIGALANLFNQGKLTMVANVGTLVAPTTRSDYINGTAAVPMNLFSHEDQSVQWMTSVPDRGDIRTGWGGRAADLVASLNSDSRVSLALSIAGTNTFEVGNTVVPYLISPDGSLGLRGLGESTNDQIRIDGFKRLLALPHNNLFEQAYSDTMSRSIAENEVLSSALAGVTVNTQFPDTDLGRQLAMVSKLIAARANLGMQRQIFFVAVGGYDTHGDQLAAQSGLLQELSAGMNAFYNATVALGVEQSVTTFTASDFGRTLPGNSGGSDHGWGSHQFVMGGAVNGNRLYGKFPTLAVDGPDDTEDGRWIPTTSVDEFSATLARWFGVSDSNMPIVFPNIGRFANPNLGFLR
ncbi:MAG: hypothetical protein QOG48_1571 [Verrucomicrobiota bacterium]|jgi:uncharacterized protein (DUF1501 family)